MRNTYHKSGSTLIELLVYMGLLGIFLVTITKVFTGILGARLEVSAYGSVANDSRYVTRRLGYDIQRASNIIQPISYGVGSSLFVVTTPEGQITYSQIGSNLILGRAGNTYRLNTDGVEVRSFVVTKTRKGTHDALNIQLVLDSTTQTDSQLKTRSLDLVYAIR